MKPQTTDAEEKSSSFSEAELDKVTERYISGDATHEELLNAERSYGVDYESATLELASIFRRTGNKIRKFIDSFKE